MSSCRSDSDPPISSLQLDTVFLSVDGCPGEWENASSHANHSKRRCNVHEDESHVVRGEDRNEREHGYNGQG